jgi:hypothetical protein
VKTRIRYYDVAKNGRGYWRAPKDAVREGGFPRSVPCGVDGIRAWTVAEEWNGRLDAWRAERARAASGEPGGAGAPLWPPRSLGEAFTRYQGTAEWAGKAESTRKEWLAAWKILAPVFGDVDPRTITLEQISELYRAVLATRGVDTAWRLIKVWRALWKVASALRYCDAGQDPSAGVRRQGQARRAHRWSEGEIVRLVKAAWRRGARGLACIVAVAWDTQLSPGDVRRLTPADAITLAYDRPGGPAGGGARARTEPGLAFAVRRGKTGAPAIGTLSRRTRALVALYLDELGAEIAPGAPLFRNTEGQPYPTKDRLSRAFERLRARVFPGDPRTLMDARRSGALEALAGGVDPGHLAAKMANQIQDARALQATYLPVDPALVRAADEARRRGRAILRANASRTESLNAPAKAV